MANPNINKYNQASKDAYLPTQSSPTHAQIDRLKEAEKVYHVVKDFPDHELPNKQLYQKKFIEKTNEFMDSKANDRVNGKDLEKHASEQLVSRNTDKVIAKEMLQMKRDPEGVAQTLEQHSPYAAKLSPEQQQQYGVGVTQEVRKTLDQEQNQRPERSAHNSHTPKTPSIDARYRDVGRDIATQDAQHRHTAHHQHQERER